MIEETGIVVAVKGNTAWVETQVKTTCGSCKAESSCPTSTVAKAFSPKAEHLQIDTPHPLVLGQFVKIGIHEHALLGASMLVYILPLLALMLGAFVIISILPNVHELVVLLFALLGAGLTLWWVSRYSKNEKSLHKFRPIFLGASNQQVSTYKHEIPSYKQL